VCEHIKLANGTHVITCGDRASHRYCELCGREAVALCDWKIPSKESGTCDRPVCSRHSRQVGRGKHLCPEHQDAYERWKAKRSYTTDQQRFLFEDAVVLAQGF
jgi:hypothetical protein